MAIMGLAEMKESYRCLCGEEKEFCFQQTVEMRVAQDPAKKAGRLLPSHQRDETKIGGLPPSCLSVNRLMVGNSTGSSLPSGTLRKEMPVDKGSGPLDRARASNPSIG